MLNKLSLLSIGCLLFLCSFIAIPNNDKQPKTITRSTELVNGKEVQKTIIVLDKTTSREDLIHTCSYLAQENVQLTFDKLTIGKSFGGLVGKSRLRIAEGQIKLPNGSTQQFKAGGITSFKSIKIQYASNVNNTPSNIEMIEIID